jgi:hypothetical protein
MGLSYLLVKDYRLFISLLSPAGDQYIDPITRDIYWARPILMETTLTAVLVMVYLIMFYDAGFSTKVDRVIKGILMLFTY